ncbi:hypothetical protein ACQ4PT_037196 [Festuca glaucescens]
MLQIGDYSYKMEDVSADGGFVVVLAGPICQVCYDRNGKPAQATGIGDMSLEGTPFSFSKRNRLVVTGCNYRLLALFGNSPNTDSNPWLPTACSSWCNGSTNSVDADSCLEQTACCEALMPMDGAREFTLTFDNISEHITSNEDSTCNAAFFLDQDDQVFMGGRYGKQRALKDALSPAGNRRMILDWAVGRGTCDQASNYNLAPMYCNSMSGCIDAPRGAGYICKCNAGYDGNPYASGGCVDINECENFYSNNCTSRALCNNTQGGYTCSCPQNMTGDGYRTGTGCTEALTTSGSPMQQPQGSNVCTHPEKNPCKYYCTDEQEGVSCHCPQGMSGDGRKIGTGCKKDFPTNTVLGVGLALVVTVTTTALCYYWAMKRRKIRRKRAELFRKNGGLLLQQRFSAITPQGKDTSAKIFSAEELKTATNNYSESQILGQGGYGTVYKGVLSDETVVAVKKSKVFDESQVEQFVNEITIFITDRSSKCCQAFGVLSRDGSSIVGV